MKTRLGKCVSGLVLAVLFIFLPFAYPSDSSLPPAGELVKKFIQRWNEEERLKMDEKYGFIEHRLYDTLDKNGSIKEHSDETFQVVMLQGHPFLRLIAKDSKPLVPGEQRKQSEREKRFLEDQRRKGADKKDDGLHVDEAFLSRFQFTVARREEIDGRPAYVVTVMPKPGNFPVRNNPEKVFSHMQGKVWVDAGDFTLARSELHLAEPTSFYGILGSVRQVDLFFERRWVADKTWMFEKLRYTIDARRLFTSIHMRQDSEYSEFKKLAQ